MVEDIGGKEFTFEEAIDQECYGCFYAAGDGIKKTCLPDLHRKATDRVMRERDCSSRQHGMPVI